MIVPLLAGAQSVRFGYFSYDNILKSMPEYAVAERGIADLRAQYDAEAKRSEDDFNAKYVEFLEEQSKLATSIRKKRQAELIDLMEKNAAFKAEGERMLRDAESKAIDSVSTKLNTVIAELGRERGYAFILNTDGNNVPYVNTELGDDITAALKERLSGR